MRTLALLLFSLLLLTGCQDKDQETASHERHPVAMPMHAPYRLVRVNRSANGLRARVLVDGKAKSVAVGEYLVPDLKVTHIKSSHIMLYNELTHKKITLWHRGSVRPD